jgi:hypothetical protein
MTTYRITLRDRETQTVVGYYNGSWTTDRCLPYAVTKQRSCILAVCLTGRQLTAISWHARISAEKMTACFR